MMPADPNHFDIAKVIMIGGWDRGRSGAEAVRQEVRAGDPYGTLNNVFPRVSITPRGVKNSGVVILRAVEIPDFPRSLPHLQP